MDGGTEQPEGVALAGQLYLARQGFVLSATPARGPLLIATGVITAPRHLKPFASLWTTPYGYALLVKLCLVAVRFGLGAWNWRRQRPQLGSEQAAGRILRSSLMELITALLVLTVTAVLVSLPSPEG